MTEIYIRGVDFKLNNKKALGIGGFHAIVAYQIETLPDEIQAYGRVGRQGAPGSIRMVIPEDELSFLEIRPDERENIQEKIRSKRI